MKRARKAARILAQKPKQTAAQARANALRKATTLKAITPSGALARDYERKLRKLMQKLNTSVSHWAIARMNATQNKNTAKQLTFELNALLKEWEGKIADYAKSTARKITAQTASYVNTNLREQLRAQGAADADRIIGVKTPETTQALSRAYERNLALIQSIPNDIITRYRQSFLGAIGDFDAARMRALAEQIGGVSARRARLIARDQIAKACGDYQQQKARAIGFTHYMWLTSRDERVSRGEGGHRALEGRIYEYATPSAIIDSYGTKGHPSQRVNCRCTAVSVMPSLSQKLVLVRNSKEGDYYELREK